jgi:hypothetical protein
MQPRSNPPLVIARARSVHPVLSGPEGEPTSDQLTENTWTQGADELNQVAGEVVATAGSGCGASSHLTVEALVTNWNGVTGNNVVLKNKY